MQNDRTRRLVYFGQKRNFVLVFVQWTFVVDFGSNYRSQFLCRTRTTRKSSRCIIEIFHTKLSSKCTFEERLPPQKTFYSITGHYFEYSITSMPSDEHQVNATVSNGSYFVVHRFASSVDTRMMANPYPSPNCYAFAVHTKLMTQSNQ